MKTAVMVLVLLICSLLIAAGCVSSPERPAVQTPVVQPAERPVYVVGVDADFPPFTVADGKGNFTGFDTEAIRWIAAKEGFNVTFIAVPWNNAFLLLENGSADIIASGVSITDKRLAIVNFSQPYYSVNMSIAARSGSNATLQDFFNGKLRVGAQEGSNNADWIVTNLVQTGKMPASNLTLFPDISFETDALLKGDIDASVIGSPSQKLEISGKPLVIIGSVPDQEEIAYAIRKNDTKLQALLNDGLSQLKKDAAWQQLKQEYGL